MTPGGQAQTRAPGETSNPPEAANPALTRPDDRKLVPRMFRETRLRATSDRTLLHTGATEPRRFALVSGHLA
jgi:hypothetical protein